MFEFRLEATAGPARAGTLTLPHGDGSDARVHAGRHPRRGPRAQRRRRAPHRRADHPRQHLPPPPAPRRGAWSADGRPAPRSPPGPADADRLRRLPGVLPRGPAHGSPRTASSSRATSTAPTARSRPSGPWRSSGRSAPTSRWPSTTWSRARRRRELALRGDGADAALARRRGCEERRARGALDGRAMRTTPAPPRYRKRSGPSSRAASTTTSGAARSRARSRGGRGPASPSAASRWASRSRSCTACSSCSRRPAPGHAPLSYGRRFSAGPARGHRPGGGSVRLRGGHPERTPRHRVAADRPGQREGRRAQGLARAARPRLRLRDLHHVSRAATCGTSSWSRTCWGCGWSRSTISASWSGWASRRAPHILDGTFDGWSREWLDRHYAEETDVTPAHCSRRPARARAAASAC